MTELINILLFFFVLFLFFSAPIPIFKAENYSINRNSDKRFYLKLSLNILIHFNLILIFSFINLDLSYYFYASLLFALIINLKIFFLDKKKNFFNYTFLLFIFITISLFLKISVDLKLEWDGLNHWLPKALSFYNGDKIQNIKNLGFAEYPHLGTYIWALFWKNSLLEYEYFGRLFYVFFYTSAIFCMFEGFFEKNLIYKSIIIFLTTILTFDIFLFGGYQEYLIFSALVILSKFLFFNFPNNNTKNNLKKYFFAIIFFQPIIWFKDEGIFYYLIIFLSFIFLIKANRDKIILALLALSFPFLQFLTQKYVLGVYGFQAEIFHDTILDNFKIRLLIDKLILITSYICISMIKYKLWIINLISLFSILIFFRGEFIRIKPWAYIMLLNFILIFLIYIQTPYDLEFLLKVTLDRLMFQTSGFYIIFTLVLLSKVYEKIKN